MRAANIEGRARLPEDGMPQRDGERELAMRQAMDKPFDAPFVKFDRAASNACPTAKTEPDAADGQTDQRVRRRPNETQQIQYKRQIGCTIRDGYVISCQSSHARDDLNPIVGELVGRFL